MLQLVSLVAQRPLPEGDIVGRNPEGAGLRPEVVNRTPRFVPLLLSGEGLPGLDDGHAVPDVSYEYGQVDDHPIDDFDHGPPTFEFDPMTIPEHHLLRRDLQP